MSMTIGGNGFPCRSDISELSRLQAERTGARKTRFPEGKRKYLTAPSAIGLEPLRHILVLAATQLVRLIDRYNMGEELSAVQLADLSLLASHRGDKATAMAFAQEAVEKDPVGYYPLSCLVLAHILFNERNLLEIDSHYQAYIASITSNSHGLAIRTSVCAEDLEQTAGNGDTSSAKYERARDELLRIAGTVLITESVPFGLWLELMTGMCLLADRGWIDQMQNYGREKYSNKTEGNLPSFWPVNSAYYLLQMQTECELAGRLFDQPKTLEAEDILFRLSEVQQKYQSALMDVAARTHTEEEADEKIAKMLTTDDEGEMTPANFNALRLFNRIDEFTRRFRLDRSGRGMGLVSESLIVTFQFFIAGLYLNDAITIYNLVADPREPISEDVSEVLQQWAIRIVGLLQRENRPREVLKWVIRALDGYAKYPKLSMIERHGLLLDLAEAGLLAGRPQLCVPYLEKAISEYASHPMRQMALNYLLFACTASICLSNERGRNLAGPAIEAADRLEEGFRRRLSFSIGVRPSEWAARHPLRALLLVMVERATPEEALAGMEEVPAGVDPYYYHYTQARLLTDKGDLVAARTEIDLAVAARPERTTFVPFLGHEFTLIKDERALATDLKGIIEGRIRRAEREAAKAAAAAKGNGPRGGKPNGAPPPKDAYRDVFLNGACPQVASVLGEGKVHEARQTALYNAGRDFDVALRTESFDAAFSHYLGSRRVLVFSSAVSAAFQLFGIREVSITATEETNGSTGPQRRMVVRLNLAGEEERYFEVPLTWTETTLQFPVPGGSGAEWGIHCFLNAAILEAILADLGNEDGQLDLTSEALQAEPQKTLPQSAPTFKARPQRPENPAPVWRPPVVRVEVPAPLKGVGEVKGAPTAPAEPPVLDSEAIFMRTVRDRFDTLLLRVMEKGIDFKEGSEARKVAVNDLARYLLDYLGRCEIVNKSFSAATTENFKGIVTDVEAFSEGAATRRLLAWGLSPEKVAALRLDEKSQILIRLHLTGKEKNDVYFVLDLRAAAADFIGFRSDEIEDEFTDCILEVALQAIGVGAIPALACLHRAIQHPGPEDWKAIVGGWALSPEASDNSLPSKAFASLAPELTTRKAAPTFREAITQLALSTMETAIAAGKIPENALFFFRQGNGSYRVAVSPEEKAAMLRDHYARVQIIIRPPIPVNLPPYFSNGKIGGFQLQPKEADPSKLGAAAKMGLDLTAGAAVFVATNFGEREGRVWRRLSGIRQGVIAPTQISKRALHERDPLVVLDDFRIGLSYHPSVPSGLAQELVAQDAVQAAVREWQSEIEAGRVLDELCFVADSARRSALADLPITGMELCVLPVGRTFIDPQSAFITKLSPQAQRAIRRKYGLSIGEGK